MPTIPPSCGSRGRPKGRCLPELRRSCSQQCSRSPAASAVMEERLHTAPQRKDSGTYKWYCAVG